MKKPVIGIVSKHCLCDACAPMGQTTFSRDEIKDAVIDNGGIPIGLFPPDKGVHNWKIEKNYELSETDKDIMVEQIKLCDGIIIQGYKTGFWYEVFVAKYCFKNDIPYLGICNGQSNVGVAFGAGFQKADGHNKIHYSKHAHKAFIKPKTKLFDIVGGTEMLVNSLHENELDRVPDGYICSATNEQGGIEVIEAPTKKFNIAVKYHPECLYTFDENQNKIFKSFIQASRTK